MMLESPSENSKIRILFVLNELAFGGTTKAILTFNKYLDKTKYDPYVFCYSELGTWKHFERKIRSHFSKKDAAKYDEKYVRNFARLSEFKTSFGSDRVKLGLKRDFVNHLDSIEPHIVHFSRGESKDWYTDLFNFQLPKQIRWTETNIFGNDSTPQYLSKIKPILFISEWLKKKSPWGEDKGQVLYNPILPPLSNESLRSDLGIKPEQFVVGRISRPGLDDGMKAYRIFKEAAGEDDVYLVVGAGVELHECAKTDPQLKIFGGTTDEVWISKFYNTIDVLLHYRKEGETFGMNIAEAMIHGKPVVSHQSYLDNAQCELLLGLSPQPAGFVVDENDFLAHANRLKLLRNDSSLRQQMGKTAKEIADHHFSAANVTRRLEQIYTKMLS